MSEWGRSGGGSLPHEEHSTGEHFKEVGEDIQREREAERLENAHRKRPWWKFWAKRSG